MAAGGDNFVKKLKDLSPTSVSIQSLSKWYLPTLPVPPPLFGLLLIVLSLPSPIPREFLRMIFNYKHAPNLVATWRQEALRTTPERKITYLYLANDVIQQSRKKGSHFIDEYAKVSCLCHVHTQPDDAQHVARKTRK
jgi:hypothetical protein